MLGRKRLVLISSSFSFSSSDWTYSSAGWYGQTNVAQDGIDAAQRGVLEDGQQSILQSSVTGPGTLTFWWKVSSQAGADTLKFYIIPFPPATISGEVNWRQETYQLGAGNKQLRWVYSKDGSSSAGQDAGWLDRVSDIPDGSRPKR